jgi:hypothetical protein
MMRRETWSGDSVTLNPELAYATVTIDTQDSVFPALNRTSDELIRDMRIKSAVPC